MRSRRSRNAGTVRAPRIPTRTYARHLHHPLTPPHPTGPHSPPHLSCDTLASSTSGRPCCPSTVQKASPRTQFSWPSREAAGAKAAAGPGPGGRRCRCTRRSVPASASSVLGGAGGAGHEAQRHVSEARALQGQGRDTRPRGMRMARWQRGTWIQELVAMAFRGRPLHTPHGRQRTVCRNAALGTSPQPRPHAARSSLTHAVPRHPHPGSQRNPISTLLRLAWSDP